MLTDLPSLPASGKLRAFRGHELWIWAAPIHTALCPPDWSRERQSSFCYPSCLQPGGAGRCLAGPEEGLPEWWPPLCRAQLALGSQAPGLVSLLPPPTSNTVSFPAISKHLDKPNPFQPSQYVLRQASALQAPHPAKPAFSLGHDFSGEGEQNLGCRNVFLFSWFLFLANKFLLFFGLFFHPHPPLFCFLSSSHPPPPRLHLSPQNCPFFSVLCSGLKVRSQKKSVTATLNPPDTGRFPKNPAAACGC